jgi:hydrogenase maturation factor
VNRNVARTSLGEPAQQACITCGDVAVAMRVVRTGGGDGLADCVTDDGATESAVDLGLLEHVAPGDRVLVHACVAIRRLEPAPA